MDQSGSQTHHCSVSLLCMEEISVTTASPVTGSAHLPQRLLLHVPAAWHREKQLSRDWSAPVLPCLIHCSMQVVVELFLIHPATLLLEVTLIIHVGWVVFFLLKSSSIYSTWHVEYNKNACLGIAFLLFVFQLLCIIWTLYFLDWCSTFPRYDVDPKLKKKGKLLFSHERNGANMRVFSCSMRERDDFWLF